LLGLEVLASALLPRKDDTPRQKVDALSIVLIFLTLFLAFGLAAGQFALEQLNMHGVFRSSQPIRPASHFAQLSDDLTLGVAAQPSWDNTYVLLDFTLEVDRAIYDFAGLSHAQVSLVHTTDGTRFPGTTQRRNHPPRYEFAVLYADLTDFELHYTLEVYLSPAVERETEYEQYEDIYDNDFEDNDDYDVTRPPHHEDLSYYETFEGVLAFARPGVR